MVLLTVLLMVCGTAKIERKGRNLLTIPTSLLRKAHLQAMAGRIHDCSGPRT
jgi:hypothetical protein